jgi:hypothetical protein
MKRRQRFGALVIAVGLLMMGVGAVGALTEAARIPISVLLATPSPAASSPAIPGETPVSSAEASPTPVATPDAPTPSPTPDKDALVRAFFADMVNATRERDADSLFAWLHPATVARYGEAACRQFLENREDPTFHVVVTSVGEPETWPYTTDDVATTIEGALTVAAQVTNSGNTIDRELHVVVIDGQVRWFTDCGTPLGAGASYAP